MNLKWISVFSILLLSLGLSAQNIRPAGLNAYAGFGFAEYDISSPASNFTMDRGVFASISGERGFEFLNSYLTFSINLLQSKGQADYNYTPLSAPSVVAPGVDFDSNLFQFGLGYKIKIFDGGWFRPYAEIGYLGGYYQIEYSNVSSNITSGSASDAKTSDSLFDSGGYLEAGVEIDFSAEFGLKIAARQADMKTGELDTLDQSAIDYKTTVVFLSVLKAF
ncbi:MAG: outer membrane beta-barrel protein [Bdellovibrionales bacterium]